MNVVMVCSGGMSSSIIVKALKKEADEKNIDLNIEAVGTTEFEEKVGQNFDMALVAPQVKHRFKDFEAAATEAGVPCELIPPQGYTPIGAPKVLDQIIKAVENKE